MFRFPSKSNALNFLTEIGVRFGTIIDVGVHEETPELRKAYPKIRHILFEPASEFFSKIAKNYTGIDYELVPVAVSDCDGTGTLRKIAITGSEISHSKLEYVTIGELEQAKDNGLCEIPTVRLDSFFKERNEPEPYLLKVDVDGFELPILHGADGIWDRIDCIVVEATSDTFLDRFQYIATRGFRLLDIVDQCYYCGVFSQVDLIFMSDRLCLSNRHLRPWETETFRWDNWLPVANYEKDLPGNMGSR